MEQAQVSTTHSIGTALAVAEEARAIDHHEMIDASARHGTGPVTVEAEVADPHPPAAVSKLA